MYHYHLADLVQMYIVYRRKISIYRVRTQLQVYHGPGLMYQAGRLLIAI